MKAKSIRRGFGRIGLFLSTLWVVFLVGAMIVVEDDWSITSFSELIDLWQLILIPAAIFYALFAVLGWVFSGFGSD